MRVKYHRSYCRKYFKKTGMSTSKRNKKKKEKEVIEFNYSEIIRDL